MDDPNHCTPNDHYYYSLFKSHGYSSSVCSHLISYLTYSLSPLSMSSVYVLQRIPSLFSLVYHWPSQRPHKKKNFLPTTILYKLHTTFTESNPTPSVLLVVQELLSGTPPVQVSSPLSFLSTYIWVHSDTTRLISYESLPEGDVLLHVTF